MGILKKLLGKNKKEKQRKATGAKLTIKDIQSLTDDAVKVVFDVPEELKGDYAYIPGQYLNLSIEINGQLERRSYSICSAMDEPLAIGVRQIKDGVVSGYLNDKSNIGKSIEVDFPLGSFQLKEKEDRYVAFVGGSGITPVLSIAKSIGKSDRGHIDIFYGNRTEKSIMFEEELGQLASEKVNIIHILSEQDKDGMRTGMLTEEYITNLLKEDLSLIKAKGFFICGPEPVIINVQNALKKLGVEEDRLFYELFTTPTKIKPSKIESDEESFSGTAEVTVILDDVEETFELDAKGDTILEEAESHGMDAPYSCRGGICSTCRAKVLEGKVIMDQNYTLSDEEVAEGYVLTCQAHPASKKVKVSYDEY